MMEESKIVRSRPLSLQEKFPVRTRNASVVCATIIVAQYDSDNTPSRAQLAKRIEYLQDQCDLLRSRVVDSDKANPKWELQDPWPVDRIIYEAPLESSSTTEEVENVLRQEFKHRADTRDSVIASESPLWRVGLHSTPNNTYIALNLQHEITDGRGMQAMFNALLSDDQVEPEPMDKVVPMEQTVGKPLGFALLARLLFRELLVPSLPWPIRGLFDPHPWPADTFRSKPLGLPGDVAVVHLDPSLVTALVALGKKHQVKLHSLLKVGYMVSIWHALDPAAKSSTPSLHRGHSPRSERDNDPRHPRMTGNYASTSEGLLWLDPTTKFWDVVRDINFLFHDPAKHAEAIKSMSLMGMLPEKASKKALTNPRIKTGWEETFIGIVNGPTPFRSSISFSNLGSSTLPRGAKDLWWSQVPSAFQPVIVPCVISHKAGLRMACVWTEGGCVVRDEVIQVNDAFVGLMKRLAEGEGGDDVVLGTLFKGQGSS